MDGHGRLPRGPARGGPGRGLRARVGEPVLPQVKIGRERLADSDAGVYGLAGQLSGAAPIGPSGCGITRPNDPASGSDKNKRMQE